jgi:hypothetical protein
MNAEEALWKNHSVSFDFTLVQFDDMKESVWSLWS